MEAVAASTRKQINLLDRRYSPKYVVLICALFAVLIFARAINDVAFYAFAGVSAVVFAISNIGHCISFLFFLLPFATILKQDPDGMSFFTLLFFLVILKMVIFHRRIDVRLLIVVVFFTAYNLIVSGMGELTTAVTMAAGILMLYYLRNDDVDLNVTSAVVTYSVGIVLSSVLALFREVLPIINTFVNESMMRLDATEYASRFSGLHGNPNYYTLDIIVALSAVIVLMYYKKNTQKLLTVFLLALSIFGLMSVSKSFLLTWLLLVVCWFFLSIKQGMGKLAKFMFVVLIGAIVTYYFAYDYINTYLFRFIEDSSGTLESITTGRTELWGIYFKEAVSDVKIFFFGNGLNTILDYLDKGPHNTYLEFLFNLGVVGSLLLFIALGLCKGRAKFKGATWIPVIMLMIRMFAIGILAYDNLWFYLAVLLMLAYDRQRGLENNTSSIERES